MLENLEIRESKRDDSVGDRITLSGSVSGRESASPCPGPFERCGRHHLARRDDGQADCGTRDLYEMWRGWKKCQRCATRATRGRAELAKARYREGDRARRHTTVEGSGCQPGLCPGRPCIFTGASGLSRNLWLSRHFPYRLGGMAHGSHKI